MSAESRSSPIAEGGGEWWPSATRENLKLRAGLLESIRRFFNERGVMEVETPLLAATTVTDPHIDSLESLYKGRRLFLQSSPEYAMKRLLAAGSGPIYQICKAFRDGEEGPRHNPEFTLLEWYRPGFDHHALMDELEELVRQLLDLGTGSRISYADIFEELIGLDPHTAEHEPLAVAAIELGLSPASAASLDRDGCLDFIFSQQVQPALERGRPVFIHDFPVSQAALARIRPGSPAVAERFELFINGVELANGYHELTDGDVQAERFSSDQAKRGRLGLPAVEPDSRLLAALRYGLPACAGVALGLDRLLMVMVGAQRLEEVIAFPVSRA